VALHMSLKTSPPTEVGTSGVGASLEGRLQREKEFHDRAFSERTRAPVDKFYSIAGGCWHAYTNALLNECQGKRVLEYGCGPGSSAFQLREHGAQVIGIDISEVAIQQAKAIAEQSPTASTITFRVMNAEDLQFPDRDFDMVCGSCILHHLNLERSLTEISRVLRESGKAVFVEPLGHNPLINLYRRLTPNLRTEDEHPLLDRDLTLIRHYFGKVQITYFHLLSLCAMPFRKTSAFDRILKMFDAMDRMLFTVPVVRKQAWLVVMELSEPRKA